MSSYMKVTLALLAISIAIALATGISPLGNPIGGGIPT